MNIKQPLREIEAIAGFRFWYVQDRALFSHGNTAWIPGEEIEARCLNDFLGHIRRDVETHKAPADRGCLCGINAFYSLEHLFASSNRTDAVNAIAGIISPSGETVLSERGFRSERARIEAFVSVSPEIQALGYPVSIRPAQEALASRYGVPLLGVEDIGPFLWAEGLDVQEDIREEFELGPSAQEMAMRASFTGFAKRMAELFKSIESMRIQASNSSDPIRRVIEEKKQRSRYYGPNAPDPRERKPNG